MSTPIDNLIISVRIDQGTKAARLLDKLDKITQPNGDIVINTNLSKKIGKLFDEIIKKINSINRIHSKWKSRLENALIQVKDSVNDLKNKITGMDTDVDLSEIENYLDAIYSKLLLQNAKLDDLILDVGGLKGSVADISSDTKSVFTEKIQEIISSIINIEMVLSDLRIELDECCSSIRKKFSDMEHTLKGIMSIDSRNILDRLSETGFIYKKLINIEDYLENEIKDRSLWGIETSVMSLGRDINSFITNIRGLKQIVGRSINEKLKAFKLLLDDNLREVIGGELDSIISRIESVIETEFNTMYETIGAVIEQSLSMEKEVLFKPKKDTFQEEIPVLAKHIKESVEKGLGLEETYKKVHHLHRLIANMRPAEAKEAMDFLTGKSYSTVKIKTKYIEVFKEMVKEIYTSISEETPESRFFQPIMKRFRKIEQVPIMEEILNKIRDQSFVEEIKRNSDLNKIEIISEINKMPGKVKVPKQKKEVAKGPKGKLSEDLKTRYSGLAGITTRKKPEE